MMLGKLKILWLRSGEIFLSTKKIRSSYSKMLPKYPVMIVTGILRAGVVSEETKSGQSSSELSAILKKHFLCFVCHLESL